MTASGVSLSFVAPRPYASPLAFALGCLLLGGAGLTFLAAKTLPAEGMQDLGRIVGSMLLAGLAAIPFALSMALAARRGMPRLMLAIATLGCLLALLPGVAFFAMLTTGGLLLGALILASGVGGLAASARLWRA